MKVKNHSYGNYDAVSISHISLDLSVDFDAKSIKGSAELSIDNHGKAKEIILDHRDMIIESTEVDGRKVGFKTGDYDSILGAALLIPIAEASKKVKVFYHTKPEAAALQWLNPAQTNDKKAPFLFSQSQAILARTWIPLMDAPAIRFTYEARVKVPKELMALMSANNPTEKSADGTYTFKQTNPIPSYLMAISAGDLAFKSLGRNSGVYAEPGYLEKCAWEFADLQRMIDSAEELYGPYRWGRYDVLVLPPSFPFGGMENPELTFATPTIIAGDRSLVSLVAHELAHSWSGNLVTNETWNDFWLNEGFTVYFEQRIMEKIYGQPYAEMQAALARGELQRTVDELLVDAEEDTRLYLDLDGRDPDEGVSDIAYEKGRFFLRSIEKVVGRPQWDAFVKEYFSQHAFQTMTTKRFLDYLDRALLSKNPDWKDKVKAEEWIYKPGLPGNIEIVHSTELDKVEEDVKLFAGPGAVAAFNPQGYTTHHWLYFLRRLPRIDLATVQALDDKFHFSQSGNSEILCDWFQVAIRYNYSESYPQLRAFLAHVGRRKFLLPLYKALASTPDGKKLAREIFEASKAGYHSVATNTLQDLLYGAQE